MQSYVYDEDSQRKMHMMMFRIESRQYNLLEFITSPAITVWDKHSLIFLVLGE